MGHVADFDDIRSLAFGSIGVGYASVGTAATKEIRGICLTNDTEGSMMFTNNVNKDKVFVKSGSFKLWDIQGNGRDKDDKYVFPIGTQISVKQLAAPISGSVYVEFLVDA